jgi:hypothetical protein
MLNRQEEMELIKEIKEKRNCWSKEKPKEKMKELGSRRVSLCQGYTKRTRYLGIKGGPNFRPHTSGALTRSALTRFRNNPEDHLN